MGWKNPKYHCWCGTNFITIEIFIKYILSNFSSYVSVFDLQVSVSKFRNFFKSVFSVCTYVQFQVLNIHSTWTGGLNVLQYIHTMASNSGRQEQDYNPNCTIPKWNPIDLCSESSHSYTSKNNYSNEACDSDNMIDVSEKQSLELATRKGVHSSSPAYAAQTPSLDSLCMCLFSDLNTK